jgi:hypothetical protein
MFGSVCFFISRSPFSSYLPFTILIRKSPSEAPVNFFNGALICDAIREGQRFRLIRPAGGGEWRFCRSIRRIERPAKSNYRERRQHGGNAAVNDVTSDSASCFYGGFFLPSLFFGIFRAKFPESLGNSKNSV